MIEVGIGKSGPHSLVRMNDCTLLLLTTDRMLGHSEFLIEFLWSVFIVAANLCISYGSSLYISYESYFCISYGSYLCICYGSSTSANIVLVPLQPINLYCPQI
uniref:Uncharacterized protein n=1 Tax=Cacopsylla melanoneura TaxID=428564 RepID=A0A8D9F3S0_9HEMI